LDHGLDPNVKDSKGATPLAYAACDGHADLVTLWLSHGADPASAGVACEHSHFDIDSVNMVCDDTATALDCARAKGYGDIVRMLEAATKK
jgi:ankyrin repeat protein